MRFDKLNVVHAGHSELGELRWVAKLKKIGIILQKCHDTINKIIMFWIQI